MTTLLEVESLVAAFWAETGQRVDGYEVVMDPESARLVHAEFADYCKDPRAINLIHTPWGAIRLVADPRSPHGRMDLRLQGS